MEHIPVLTKEVIEYLKPESNQNFIDATYGFGGHSKMILERTSPNGKILGIEWNEETFKKANEEKSERVILVNDSYTNLEKIVQENNFKNISAILFDLGLSSWELETSDRGFTFQKDQALDMRFSASNPLTAKEIVNQWSRGELERIFREYGEERFARKIAEKIILEREKQTIETTFQLIEIIKEAIPKRFLHTKIHFSTRVFQALRIAVNNELENIKIALPQSLEVLEKGGKIAVISFHSLEDRIVKHFFKEQAELGKLKILTKKPITPGEEEINLNKKARSAKLRVAEKI